MNMLKKNWAAVAFLGLLLSCLVAGATYAQVSEPVDAVPVVTPAVPAVGGFGPQNPLPADPTDLIPVIKVVIEAFGTAWYLGLALVLYLLVNFMRGKLKIGSWIIRIPVVSDWLDGVGKTWKAVLIISVTGVGGAFAGMALAPTPWTAGGLATVMVSGLISGVLLALAAGGVDSLVSTAKKPEVVIASVAAKTEATGKLPKLDEATLAEIEKWAVAARAKLDAPK
jgi:hypothetical protein